MLELTSTPHEGRPVDREVLLTIDGTPYTIPTRFRPLEMARYAHMVNQDGADIAAVWALQAALGETAYLKLLNLPAAAVSDDTWRSLMAVVTGRLLGLERAVPGPKWEPPAMTEVAPETEAETAAEKAPQGWPPAGEWTEPDSSPDRTETPLNT